MRGAAVIVIIAGAAVGCGTTRLRRVQLEPPASALSAHGARVEVREVGVARKVRWRWSDDRTRLGVTVDAKNQSGAPLTIDAGGTSLELDSPDSPAPTVARAVASGPGRLPTATTVSAAPLPPLTLEPGQAGTLWILFDRGRFVPGSSVALRLATSDGQPTRLVLLEGPRRGPRWSYEPATLFGVSTRIETHLFGTEGYGAVIGFGGWIARGPVRLDLGCWFGFEYAHSSDGALARAFTVGFGPTLGWRPWQRLAGLFAAGAMSFANFNNAPGLQNRNWSPSVSVGIETASEWPAPPFFFRLGYVHIFDESVARKDGVMFMMGTHTRIW